MKKTLVGLIIIILFSLISCLIHKSDVHEKYAPVEYDVGYETGVYA